MRALSRYLDFQDAVCKIAVVILMVTVLAAVCAGIVWRSVLNDALPWANELARFCLVWIAFLGSPVVLRRNGHVALDVIVESLKGHPERTMRLVISLVVASVAATMCWAGWNLAYNARTQISSTLPITQMVIYLSIPIGSAAMVIVTLEQIGRNLTGRPPRDMNRLTPETGE